MGQLIYLIGFMGSGKSTAGKKLAKKLQFSFTDLDDMIEQKYRITIPSIFSRFDEAAFRKIEHETLKQTLSLNKHVISTGGGTPCFYDNIGLINQNGISVYLHLKAKSLYSRLMNSKKKRPLLAQKPPEKVLDFINKKLNEREFFYKKAHLTVEAESLDFNELVNLLKTNTNFLNNDH